MWVFYIASAILGYLLGSIPTGYLVGRLHGIDIREHGSKNMGATNVVRVLGKRPGYIVFTCDALKGLLAVVLSDFVFIYFPVLNAGSEAESETVLIRVLGSALALNGILAGLACILGHNFPVWLRFKGGKGVATTVGVLLGLMPAAVGITAVVWCATYYLTRYVSLASLLGAAALPISVWFLNDLYAPPTGPPWLFYFSLLAAALIFWRHRANIQRLLNGTEPRFVRKSSAAAPPPL